LWRGIVKVLRRAIKGNGKAGIVVGKVIYDQQEGLAGGYIEARHDWGAAGIIGEITWLGIGMI